MAKITRTYNAKYGRKDGDDCWVELKRFNVIGKGKTINDAIGDVQEQLIKQYPDTPPVSDDMVFDSSKDIITITIDFPDKSILRSIRISRALYEQSQRLGINFSQAARDGVKHAIEEELKEGEEQK